MHNMNFGTQIAYLKGTSGNSMLGHLQKRPRCKAARKRATGVYMEIREDGESAGNAADG